MRESLGELIGGYRQETHSGYSFSAFLIDETICFEEEYDYYSRADDDDARTYVYGLSIEMTHYDAFLALLLKRCGSEQAIPQHARSAQLRTLLKQLVAQGMFKDARSTGIKENLTIVHQWLEEEGIPHQPPHLAF